MYPHKSEKDIKCKYDKKCDKGSVFFVFVRKVSDRLKLVHNGLLPRTLCYSIEVLISKGFSCFWSDAGHKRPKLSSWFNYCFRIIVRRTCIGFNFYQSIILIPQLRRANIIFATVDSVALPTLFLKKLGLFRALIVYQTIGLSESLASGSLSRWQIWLFQWLSSAAAKIIVTPAESSILRERLKVPISKIVLNSGGCGVDIAFFDKNYSKNIDGSYVLCVGRDAQRDFKIICEVALLLPEIQFVIIASYSNAPIGKIPINVTVKCEISYQEVLKYYKYCRFVVNPVKENPYTFGWIVVAEAMALRKAVIISRVSALKGLDFFQSGQNCILVTPSDTHELSEAIKMLWNNSDVVARLGNEGRKIAETYFHLDHYSSLLTSIFKSLLKDINST